LQWLFKIDKRGTTKRFTVFLVFLPSILFVETVVGKIILWLSRDFILPFNCIFVFVLHCVSLSLKLPWTLVTLLSDHFVWCSPSSSTFSHLSNQERRISRSASLVSSKVNRCFIPFYCFFTSRMIENLLLPPKIHYFNFEKCTGCHAVFYSSSYLSDSFSLNIVYCYVFKNLYDYRKTW
jgi:hypothetical protein